MPGAKQQPGGDCTAQRVGGGAGPALHTAGVSRDPTAAERNQAACELHDAISQKLFAASLLAGALAHSETTDSTVREQARVLELLNRSALAEMRMMLFELQPEAMCRVRLPDLLQQAVDGLSARSGVAATTEIDDSAPLCAVQRAAVYRIATALLSNIARHSGASHARLSWSAPLEGLACLRITDDGCGFDVEDLAEQHQGLARVRGRASDLGAQFTIKSAPGEGTDITLTFQRS